MTRPANPKPRIVPGSRMQRMLFEVYNGLDVAWDEGGEDAVLQRLCARKLVRRLPDGVYAITAAGRAALGIPARRRRFRMAVKVIVDAMFPADPSDDEVTVTIEVEAGTATDEDTVLARVTGLPVPSAFDHDWEYNHRIATVETYLGECGFLCSVAPVDVLMHDHPDDVRVESIPGAVELRAVL